MNTWFKATGLKDYYGKEYFVEIIDKDYSGETIEINVDGNGWNVDINGSQDDPHTRILTSTASVNIFIENSSHEELLTELSTAPEGRFFLRITKTEGFGSLVIFLGFIVVDRITWENMDYPFSFKVSAICGLAKLKDREYKPDVVSTYNLYTRLSHKEHIFRILGLLELEDFFPLTEVFLLTIMNWYESNMANTTDDPLTMVNTNWWGFSKEEDLNSFKFSNAFEALEMLAIFWNARVYCYAGRYYFEQINSRLQDTNDSWSYKVDGTLFFKADITNTTAIIDGTDLSTETGSTFSLIPPVREIVLTYNFKADLNYLHDQLDSFNYLATGEQEVGVFEPDGENECRFLIRGRLRWENETYFDFDPFLFTTWKMRFVITLKVGDKWLKRERLDDQYYNTGFGPTTWEDTESFYYLDSEIFYYDTLFSFMGGYIDVNVLTPNIEEGGDVIFNIDLYKVFVPDSILVTEVEAFETSFLVKWYYDFPQLNLTLEDGEPYMATKQVYRYLGPVNNSRKKEISLYFSDGPNSTNIRRILVWDGAEWVESGREWSPLGTELGVSHQRLLLLDVASVLVNPIKCLNGNIIHHGAYGMSPIRTLNYHSERYIFMSGMITGTQADFNGSWFKFNPEDIE